MASTPRHRGLQALHDQFIGSDPVNIALFEEAKSNAEVARAIYQMRKRAGLTQGDLAARVGTATSVISRLEDADYEGHSLSMLTRIAAALGRRVRLEFPLMAGNVKQVKTVHRVKAKSPAIPKASAKPKAPMKAKSIAARAKAASPRHPKKSPIK